MAVKCLAGLSTKTIVLIGAAVTTIVIVAIVVPVVVTQNDDDSSSGSSNDTNDGGNGDDSLGQSKTQGTCPGGETYYITGLTAEEQQQIVDAHNYYRNVVARGDAPHQSGATDMLEMVWSNEIAQKAYDRADDCVFSHDTYDDRATTNFPSVGQNLAYKAYSNINTAYDLDELVDMWYDEVDTVSTQITTDPYASVSGTGHYTQLAWARSYAIGCGFKKYYASGYYRHQLTCNYGPAGNVIGSVFYTEGTFSAGGCTHGASSDYDSLCKHA